MDVYRREDFKLSGKSNINLTIKSSFNNKACNISHHLTMSSELDPLLKKTYDSENKVPVNIRSMCTAITEAKNATKCYRQTGEIKPSIKWKCHLQ